MMSLKKLIDDYEKKKRAFNEKVSTVFVKEIVAEYKKIPNLKEVRWKQYTPFFNDGEACEFSVRSPSYKFVDTSEDAGDYEDGFVDSYEFREAPEIRTQLEELEETFFGSSTMGEILKDLYGDHVQVTINLETEQAEVDDYDHE
jgi:hypothetical protein